MKKIKITFIFLFLVNIATCQFYVGINGNGIYPLSDFKQQVDFGYGSNVTLGYKLNNSVAFSLGYEYSKFKSLAQDYKHNSGFISVNYLFTQNEIIPYIGIQSELIRISRLIFENNTSENDFALTPNFGILFDAGFLSNLKINTNFSYTNIFKDNNNMYLKFSLGICYLLAN